MAIKIKDGDGDTKYVGSSGDGGSSGDPYVPEHLESNSAAVLTKQTAIASSLSSIQSSAATSALTDASIASSLSSAVTHLANCVTSLQLLDNAIASGDELQTDIVGSLPAGSATIGNVNVQSFAGTAPLVLSGGSASIGTLGANSGTDIGDVTLNAGAADVGNVGTKNLTTIATGERQGSVTAAVMPTVSCSLARIKAVSSNAGSVFIGISGVTKVNGTTDTTSGLELSASEETGWMPTDNLNRFFLICDNAGDDVTYMTMT